MVLRRLSTFLEVTSYTRQGYRFISDRHANDLFYMGEQSNKMHDMKNELDYKCLCTPRINFVDWNKYGNTITFYEQISYGN